MNFHKTIGFLATLLLIVGLGVPDSFAQEDVTVSISLSRDNYVRESSSVVVTVTLAKPVATDADAVTISVTLSATADYDWTVDGEDDVSPTSIEVDIDPGESMGTAKVTITDDETFRDTGMLTAALSTAPTGYVNSTDNATVSLGISDDDLSAGTLVLTISPPSFSVAGAVTVTVTAKLPEAPGTGNTVTVNVSAKIADADLNTAPSSIEISDTDNSGTSTLTLDSNEAAAEGTVMVVISAEGYEKTTRAIPIIERNASDVEGFRVTIAPADGAWLGSGNKKVKVIVTRLDNILSFPWTAFTSIAISLRDTADVGAQGSRTPRDFITVTASNFADESGNIVFDRTVADNDPAAPNPGVATGNSNITYSQTNDMLTFDIELDVLSATNVAGVLGTLFGEEANGTKGTAAPFHPQAGLTAMGRRMGVFAHAVFTVGDNTYEIQSRDIKKEVFSNPSALADLSPADRVVGDGKLFKIDLIAPANALLEADFNVTINGEAAAGGEAKIGDEISAAAAIASRLRLSRDHGLQIQFQTLSDAGRNLKGGTVKTVNFTQTDVLRAQGDSLRTSLDLDKGLIKTQYTNPGHSRDGVEVKKSALFEPDNVDFRVRVRTKDQAGNFSLPLNVDFTADTRAPGISVLHPPADGRFSGGYEDLNESDYNKYLKPLQLRVDERDLDSLYVYVDGAMTGKLGDDDNASAIIHLYNDGDIVPDKGEVVKKAGTTTVGDTIVYNTMGLKTKNAKGELKATGQGGTKVNLVIVAKDMVGNETKMILTATHDEMVPTIDQFFPKNDILEGDNNQINDATRHPVFTLKEDVDSLAIVYDPSSGSDIVHVVADGLPRGEHQEIIADAFVHNRTYSLTIFARDLAGNVFMTDADDASDLRFNEQFENPIANVFTIANMSPAESDSVVAGQAFYLEIQAVDNNGTPNNKDDDRNAVTYKNDMASEVRISAWADGGAAESVRFHGGGVTDNGDGSATLNAGGWKLGKRTVYAKSNQALDLIKVLVEHRSAGQGGTSVVEFDGSIDSLYVDAADFAGFEITAWEDGVDGAAQEVWGDFNLRVIPVDKFGNPSVKAYDDNPSKGNNSGNATSVTAATDSLDVLDTRVGNDGINYKNGFDITLRSLPDIGLPPFEWTIELAGETFPVSAPSNVRQVAIQVRVDNTSLQTDDKRSANVKTNKTIAVRAPLDLSITLWVPGQDGDQAGNDVVIPADPGEVTVTARAEGLNEGDMVTFTKNGTAMDPVAADADGYAGLMIMMSAAGSVTVSAASGQYSSDELTITFVEGPSEPMRMAYADSEGNPVYLIASGGDMEVNVEDFLAFVAAYGSSSDADNYNIQADIDDDGDVDIDDFLAFISSYGRTAVGPATKPLVLAPGINENAEFSLSLGSERVVAGELVAVDVSLANVAALMGYGFTLNYETDNFEFISVAPADEDLLTSTGGETLFHHVVADGQVSVATGMYNGTAVSGGGEIVRFVFRVLREFEDNARFEIANGLVFDPSQLQNPAVVAGVLELQSTPREFALHQNFPNPFNPDTTIKYDLAESADVTLQIYNVLGQVVRTLVASEAQNAGRYQIRWNGMDDRGVPVSSGIYFYQIAADGKFSDVRKLMLLK